MSLGIVVSLLVTFILGTIATRWLQRALRDAVRPNTRLDSGARNVEVTGVGYVGMTMSAIVAVSTAVLDMSNFAVVAGAISLGIGFGMQTGSGKKLTAPLPAPGRTHRGRATPTPGRATRLTSQQPFVTDDALPPETMMQTFSLLDLSPIPEGQTATEALANTVDLARAAERAGYHRYWLAEHHNMPGIASAATAVVIGHVAGATSTMRIGAGGIMLPNHAPLMVAEQFGTLATLYPGRIDLGLGRAPGTDMATARALRRHMAPEDSFPQDVQELIGYLGDIADDAPVRAIPGSGTHVPVWILGSSLYGAQLAAWLGLPYAFASHFAPALLDQALDCYRTAFRPSETLGTPHVMVAAGVCAADTDTQAEYLRSSQLLAFARLRSGQPGKLPRPVRDVTSEIPPPVLAQVQQALSCSATGSAATVDAGLRAIIDRHRPDELIVTGMIHDHAARVRSFEIVAEVLSGLCDRTP